jgi:alpha-glucoside transport system permease protein
MRVCIGWSGAPAISFGRPPPPPPPPPPPRGNALWVFALRVVGVVAIPIAAFYTLWVTFDFLRDSEANRVIVVGVAVVVGGGGVFFLYWVMNRAVELLPERYREGVRPWIFVGPALVLLSVFLVYPVINTILISFKDAQSQSFVGLDNFKFVFTDESMLRAIRNTLGWMILVPVAAVTTGLAFATLADRLRRGEAVAKSIIFLPMAISFAGASITWRLIYSFRPAGFGSNIGLLNGIMLGLGQNPVDWLSQHPWNNLYLMVIMVWMQTGFAMVVLSAAIKSIPDEIIEAARIDGASEWQVFRRIMVPSILPTIVVVATYMVINSLKVFDIVFVMGSAELNQTEVIAERMIRWFFIGQDYGKGAAIAVVLFIVVIPVMVWNVRRFREEEMIR